MQGCHKHSVYKNAVPGKYNKVKDNNIRHAKARKSYAIHYYIQRKKDEFLKKKKKSICY